MALIQLTHRELVGQDNPMPMLHRINQWHQLEGEFELMPGSSRSEYRVEARFPTDEAAIEFLKHLFQDEDYALDVWRQQP